MKRDIEHQTQRACVNWFRYIYDDALIFAVPNGGRRDKETGSRLKAEGVLAGVADIIILSSAGTVFVEMKTKSGTQAASQKDFQKRVEALGYHYYVCRSFDEFQQAVEKELGKR